MVLVDTSVWIDHFRRTNSQLTSALIKGEVLIHSMVIGEIALGQLKKRTEILSMLKHLPMAENPRAKEIYQFIEDNKLYGKGIAWVDAVLLASAMLEEAQLLSLDKKLVKIYKRLKIRH